MEWWVDTSNPRAVSDLRREIGDYLRRHAADPDAVPEAELVVSELLTNAAVHTEGPAWASLRWSGMAPVLTVEDLGEEFDIEGQLPDDPARIGGRGLYLAAHLTHELARASKRAGGNKVSARLPVTRPPATTFVLPPRRRNALPTPEQARPEGGFPREPFLLALTVQLANAIERLHGPDAAERAVAEVASDVGGRMEDEYRDATAVTGPLDREHLADCLIRLKDAIEGDFYVVEASDRHIVFGNRRCPFGPVVQRAPGLCRMTSGVFGTIAARAFGEATVVLDERIAVGDPECRVVVHLGPAPEVAEVGHRYASDETSGRAGDRAGEQPGGS